MSQGWLKSMQSVFAGVLLFGMWLHAPTAALAQDARKEAAPLAAADIEQIVRDVIRKNPELIVQAIRQYQEDQERLAQEQAQMALRTHQESFKAGTSAPVVGNPDGDVTIVEFFDYRCGYCKKVFPEIQALLEEDTNIRYVMKEFPILGEESQFASRIALAGWNADPSKYMDLHAALMMNRGSLSVDRVMKLANEAGYDASALRTDAGSAAVEKALRSSYQLAESLNIRGTPAFIIGDELVPGAVGLDRIKELVAKARGS